MTNEFAVDFDVWSCFFDVRVTIGGTGVPCSKNKSLCLSVAIDIELFHNCKGAVSFCILVALDMEEVESGRRHHLIVLTRMV